MDAEAEDSEEVAAEEVVVDAVTGKEEVAAAAVVEVAAEVEKDAKAIGSVQIQAAAIPISPGETLAIGKYLNQTHFSLQRLQNTLFW